MALTRTDGTRRTSTPPYIDVSALAAADPLRVASLAVPDRTTTRDPELARLGVAGQLSSHGLTLTGSAATFEAHLAAGNAGPVRLLELEYGTDVRIRRDPSGDYIGIGIPLSGAIRMRSGGTTLVAQPYRTMIVAGDDQPVDISWTASTKAVVVRLDRTALSGALQIVLPHKAREPIQFFSAPLSGAGAFAIYGGVQLIARAFEECGSPDAVPPGLARLLAQQMLVTVLLSVPHSFSARLHEPAWTASDARVRAAMRIIADEQSGDRTALDLAAELGVSLRALELGFRRELDTTPHEYLRTSRLGRINEELTRADPGEVTVAVIAGKWGFANHGRFARAYRDLFGELPSETLRS